MAVSARLRKVLIAIMSISCGAHTACAQQNWLCKGKDPEWVLALSDISSTLFFPTSSMSYNGRFTELKAEGRVNGQLWVYRSPPEQKDSEARITLIVQEDSKANCSASGDSHESTKQFFGIVLLPKKALWGCCKSIEGK